MSHRSDVIVTAAELAIELEGEQPIILDVRSTPGEGSSRDDYRAGHIRTARFVDFAADLAGEGGGIRGNNPLPEVERLQAALRRWGVHENSRVVVYGHGSLFPASRAWFVLRWAGVADVRFLDGGLDAWVAGGGGLVDEEPPPAAGSFTVRPGSHPTLDADEAAELGRRSKLLDARREEDYLGRSRGSAGHIPGAILAPATATLDERQRLRDTGELLQHFAGLGVEAGSEVGVYCGGGVAASHEALVLASLGIRAAVYVGSWSAWSADPDRPVVAGPGPYSDGSVA
jgi:thiosulfate/3-mercaptopyruvate sulfurtransferase